MTFKTLALLLLGTLALSACVFAPYGGRDGYRGNTQWSNGPYPQPPYHCGMSVYGCSGCSGWCGAE